MIEITEVLRMTFVEHSSNIDNSIIDLKDCIKRVLSTTVRKYYLGHNLRITVELSLKYDNHNNCNTEMPIKKLQQ